MPQLYANLPLDIVVYAVRFLNPRDFVILRRINRAHRDIFCSEHLCRVALRAFFGRSWAGPTTQHVSARVTFDNTCRQRDNLRQGNWSRFEVAERGSEDCRSLIGTDKVGNHVLVVSCWKQKINGSFQVHWLEGDDIQRNTELRVFVDLKRKVMRCQAIISAKGSSSPTSASTITGDVQSRHGQRRKIPASYLHPLEVQCGKIVVTGVLPMDDTVRDVYAVIDLGDITENASQLPCDNLPTPIPLEHVWIPELLLNNSLMIPVTYFAPGTEMSGIIESSTVGVNEHYVVYKDLFQVRRMEGSRERSEGREHIVVLPLGGSIPLSQKSQPWSLLAQRAVHAAWDALDAPTCKGAVGADKEGRLCFALAPAGSRNETGLYEPQFAVMFIYVYKIMFDLDSELADASPSLTKIAQIPLYGIPERDYRFSLKPEVGKPLHYRMYRKYNNFRVRSFFHTPPHLPCSTASRCVTFSVSLQAWRDRHDSRDRSLEAEITASYTFPSVEDQLLNFLHSTNEPDFAGTWAERDDGTRWLRPDADGFITSWEPEQQYALAHTPDPEDQESHEFTELEQSSIEHPRVVPTILPVTELSSWFSLITFEANPSEGDDDGMEYVLELRIPVYARSSPCRPRTAWPCLPKWPGDAHKPSHDPNQQFWAGTYCPWYVVLKFANGGMRLPDCHCGHCIVIKGVGESWLVYDMECGFNEIYKTVVVRYD
ncbi:hypothetical protein BDZ91DRAFT_851976, partial [Kalaharituber pfeilii]